ncbi:hypothetical protein PCASD_07181 [Puccinia coronata f. sp. avenae]|uniref:Uncharacterized protein n=1 Tax=Puccinia coronata f. sp. avenae TaxID=200324 RepID=A0A2N5SUX1_9BASI|nr:hypothetical protein PCASD_19353 [Puccinia coronata f. sp. avenae]PLW41476.1 hypothetical protein PCASD_07181 [Puccinia coronata f. sp. avenae]
MRQSEDWWLMRPLCRAVTICIHLTRSSPEDKSVRIQSDAGTRGAGFVEYTTGSESNRMLLRFPTQESLSEGKESSPTSAPVGSPISANKKESKVVCGMPHLHPQLIFHQAHFSTADPHSISSMSKMLGPENRHQKSIRLVLRAQKRLD